MTLRPAVVLSELSDAQQRAVGEACAACGLEVDGWPALPHVRSFVLGIAVPARVGRLERQGWRREGALRLTATAFGISTAAARSRLYRPIHQRRKKLAKSDGEPRRAG